MATTKRVRRSVTLPSQVDKEIEAIAKKRRLSGNHVLVELVEIGLEARKQKERAFFDLAKQFRESDDHEQVKRLGDELGRFVFGEPSPRRLDWSSYLASAPVASRSFVENVEDLPVQDREP